MRRSKGKNKEKVNNAILFDKTSFEKMLTEAPKYKMITISILSDRLRVNCSLARRAIRELNVRAKATTVAAAPRLLSFYSRQYMLPVNVMLVFAQVSDAGIPHLFFLSQDRGLIRPVATHGRQVIYTRATNAA